MPRPRRRSSGGSAACSSRSRRRPARSSTPTGAARRPLRVALTRREQFRRGRLLRRRKLEYRLHRVSDWVTGGTHEIADLLHDCDILAIKAASGLEGVPRAVVMQWLLLVESHLLGFIERHRDDSARSRRGGAFAASERAELRRIEEYTFRAGEKRARMRYVEGMLGLGRRRSRRRSPSRPPASSLSSGRSTSSRPAPASSTRRRRRAESAP